MLNIKEELLNQLKEINERLNNVDDFKEWAILQLAKSNVLSSLEWLMIDESGGLSMKPNKENRPKGIII